MAKVYLKEVRAAVKATVRGRDLYGVIPSLQAIPTAEHGYRVSG